MQLDLMRALLIDDDNKEDQQQIFSGLQNMFIETDTVRSQMIDKYAAIQKNSLLHSAPTERNKIDRLIDRVAEHVSLDSELIHAVVNAESAYQPEAVSHAGAQGLMQLMPATAAELGVRDSFDAEQNLLGGSRYLRQLLDKYEGDLDHALAAYNWGQGNVDRQGLDKMPQETRQYIARIRQSLQSRSA
jgi:soluble lytic murein transglycosylase-like protein